ncbi:hypothetical protein SADUNF_Sadunf18G0087500 [Salix dunnii]|uniref:RNA polymerase II C-terminal domain phosphatase-like n=1 Tax=Salix dunnii TaxID=1413687 RepID=A0A835J3D8_9ROSI|nr:hypothetical protein SADUNF_Sadunf18G0087500 [Salix dunnii]
MSLVTDSPVHSSSSDDFAAFLDTELDSKSSASSSSDDEAPNQRHSESAASSSPDQDKEAEEDDDSDFQNKRQAISEFLGFREEHFYASVKRPKVETVEIVEDDRGTTSIASLKHNPEASFSKEICTHPGSFGTMCIVCGQLLDGESGVTFGYIHKGLRLGNDEIVRLRNTDMKNLLRHKKLYLILDLDHTLLNSTQLMHMTSDEEYLKGQTDSLQDVSKGNLFMLSFMQMMTKLRPFVRTFLKEASQMFEMYIYTMGDRAYALEMAKLLDPEREYFNAKVISRDDGTQRHQKGLDVVLGQESAVLILDDTENAWMKHKDNLILMERYHFFASSCHQFGFNCKSLSEQKSDESESEGALASILKVLLKIHQIFFEELEENLDGRDVRQVKRLMKIGLVERIFLCCLASQFERTCICIKFGIHALVLKTVRKDVLKGCKIVFSRVFPTQFQAENHHLWRMAEQLGATCSTELDPSVTHVVSKDAGTEKSHWALKHNKFLVQPGWIEAANYFWQKQPEENFSVNQIKS